MGGRNKGFVSGYFGGDLLEGLTILEDNAVVAVVGAVTVVVVAAGDAVLDGDAADFGIGELIVNEEE